VTTLFTISEDCRGALLSKAFENGLNRSQVGFFIYETAVEYKWHFGAHISS
jgi:hypothetical protein